MRMFQTVHNAQTNNASLKHNIITIENQKFEVESGLLTFVAGLLAQGHSSPITLTTAPVSTSITKRRTTKHQTATTSAKGTTKQATAHTPAQAPASGYTTTPSPSIAEMARILPCVSQDKPASTPQQWEGMPPPSTHTTGTTVWNESYVRYVERRDHSLENSKSEEQPSNCLCSGDTVMDFRI
uniref:Uncharacterized protein n=1 Tax=Cladonia uncialis subsp. uncialis TaxID=180999 RepID=A0A2K9YDK0_CLAUC|nr:hypothetical protein [Cladonia uncialis subsp. uncialis]